MRYLTTIVLSAPVGLACAVWGALGPPWGILLLAGSCGILIGCVIGVLWSSALRRHLLDPSANAMARELPWGPMLFLLVSLLIGVGAFVLYSLIPSAGLTAFRVAAVVWGVLFIGLCSTIASTVRRLEEDRGSHVVIVPGGLSFDE